MKIKIKVHANSSKEKIERISDIEYEVWIKEKPVEGKGNSYLEKFLKKHLGKKFRIVSGFTSKTKFVEVYD
ncbi:MAG: DUF167 domain-containing protein [archaeon]|nr:DUF167 domain-containing protein [archaeon]